MTFEELGLRAEVLTSLTEKGFSQPTPIQEKAIPELLANKSDFVGLAQTGTGKTAAFGLPMIEYTDFSKKNTQAVVIAPTRELCLQICDDIKFFTKRIKGANIVPIYGGSSIEKQIQQIKKGAQIVVATPGRLADLIGRKKVKLNTVDVVVLDEADEMLNMGFKDELDAILETTPDLKSTWLFSATMPKEVARIARNYMENPLEVTVGGKNLSAENIEHQYFVAREKNRYLALKRIIDFYPNIFGLIFCRTRRETQQVADKLMRDGYNAEPLHGDLSQLQRDQVMKKFRDRTLQILVATDVAARGIDVNDVTHVINYNLPDDIENYTHRSGRTARAGKSGISMVFITPKEIRRIKQVEKQIGKKFTEGQIPSGEQVCEKQLYSLIDKLVSVEVQTKEIDKFMPGIYQKLEDLSREEIIQRFVSTEFNRFLDYYRGSANLNESISSKDMKRADKGRESLEPDENMQRFFINCGDMDDLNKGMLVRLICDMSKVKSGAIGRIDIKREFSFFEVKKEEAHHVFSAMNGSKIDGRKVRIEYTETRNSRDSGGRGKRRKGGKRFGRRNRHRG